MASFLLFTLYAPMAAFGDIAVGERRGGFDRPGRSAILGLVAAALGIDRRDEEGHAALGAACALALRVESTGQLMQDYHTVQAPPARKGKVWRTRREAMDERRLETLLSVRDYRTDPLATVALLAQPDPEDPARLDDIAQALKTPAYVLYAGRKACPPGLPLRPLVVRADDLGAAFAAFDGACPEPEATLTRMLGIRTGQARYYADAAFGLDVLGPHFTVTGIERRRDEAVSRRRRQFGLRDELVLQLNGGAGS